MKKILIPTDFTQASLSALKVAAKIAKRNKKTGLRLAHVYHVPRLASLPSEDYGYDVRKQKEIVAGIRKKIREISRQDFIRGVKIETHLIPHMKVEDLIKHKENKDADLIICGVHGNKDWQQTMDGSHTETIIRSAKCPVMIVHQNISDTIRFDDVVFASDFSPETFESFPAMKKVFVGLGARIHLVKIVTPTHFETTIHVEKQMKEFAKKFYLTGHTIKVFNDQNIEMGIHRYAYSINANLIAMETHGYSGFVHYLKGSILESVAHHSRLPVLCVLIKIPATSD